MSKETKYRLLKNLNLPLGFAVAGEIRTSSQWEKITGYNPEGSNSDWFKKVEEKEDSIVNTGEPICDWDYGDGMEKLSKGADIAIQGIRTKPDPLEGEEFYELLGAAAKSTIDNPNELSKRIEALKSFIRDNYTQK